MYQDDIERMQHNVEQPPPTSSDGVQESIITVGQEEQVEQPQLERNKRKLATKFPLVDIPRNLLLAYQSLGVVYGDLSTSPLYVFNSIFVEKLPHYQTPETIFGAFSLIFWTITLIPLLKYVLIVLSADDNGEGGTFALYSLLCRHAKFNQLPNQQAADEELSTYKYGFAGQSTSSSGLKRFLEKHKKSRTILLIVVLLGACMVIGDGILTPAMSVISAISGIKAAAEHLSHGEVLVLSCLIMIGLFALQHFGTHRVGFLFAPVVIIWLITIFGIGLYNIIFWNPKIVHALSPHYIIKFFRETRKHGWISLGGVLLSVAGTEAMFADLGHFTSCSMRIAFSFLVYPCLVVQYMGQAAFLSKNLASIPDSFYNSIPDIVYWPVFVIATLASIVASQSIITATFSIVKQLNALGCFPRVKIVHTSKHVKGQIYIPEINWILMILTLSVAVGFQDTIFIGNAYGLACITSMFVTTFLTTLVMIFVWQRSIVLATCFLLFFWFIEGVYLSSAFTKFPQGGWISLVLAFVFLAVMFIWHYGTRKKYNFDLHNKVPLKWLLGMGPSLGIVRVPGIGLVYSELATGRICPRPYRMYRCIVRYGYKDIQRDDGDFEDLLIQSIAEFIQMEAVEPQLSSSETPSLDGRMAVISKKALQSTSTLIISEDFGMRDSIQSSKSLTLQSLRSAYADENPQIRRRQVRFQLPENPGMDPAVKDELRDLIQAKEAGVAYIMGHSYVKARRSSSFLKKFVVDIGYSFLRKNCRGPSVVLNIPQISLIEVGMIYHV
ncbi:Potassium transporter 4 [Capsicum annuum]|uniref:Potassium transporter n=1 Tax=Capsicum annuum TaxID=4072 RepID=A0A1U8ETP7_CAPAN|nr:potassium transporter 4 isoform X3 [Capsicum annuum]PHT95561.1 Potassium transporter 4 [Capsicum annuum]